MGGRFKRIVSNLTFREKLYLTWLLVGVVPMVLAMVFFAARVMKLAEYQNRYALEKNLEQSCQAIEGKVGNMEEIARFLLADSDVREAFRSRNVGTEDLRYLEQYEKVEATRRIFVDSNSVDEIVFYLDTELPMVGKSSGNKYRQLGLVSGEKWCGSMMEGGEYARWAIIKSDPACFMEEYFSYVHVVPDSEDYGSTVGLVCLGIRLEELEKLLVPVLEEQYLCLVAADGEIVCGIYGDGGLPSEDDGAYYSLSREVDSTGVRLVSAIPKSALQRRTMKSIAGMVAVLAVLIGMVSLAYRRISGQLTERIGRLAQVCRQSEDGVLAKVEVNGDKDEVSTLCRAYNRMTDKIQELLKEQYRIGEEVKDAQLKALQAQINPHFLYNTLEMISWMAAKEDKKRVQGIVRSLSRYYKSVLNKGKDEIDIWDEIRMGEAYMEIQGCRFKGKIRFASETDETIPDFPVPKLILQPLLENAIFHGIQKKREGRGSIWLKAYRKAGNVVLEVSDDGVGFKSGEAELESGQGSRYGLANIRRRIELFWGEGAEMRVESTPGIGTSVYIVIPDIRGGEESL